MIPLAVSLFLEGGQEKEVGLPSIRGGGCVEGRDPQLSN